MFRKTISLLVALMIIINLALSPWLGTLGNTPEYKSKLIATKIVSKKTIKVTTRNQTLAIQKPLQPAVENKLSPSAHAAVVKNTNPQPSTPNKTALLPLLARIIHAEAGGESIQGQVAVGAVLLNRLRTAGFPKTLAANIFKPGEFESVSNGYIWSNPSAAAFHAAKLALAGWDPTTGAIYFYNPAKTTSHWIWSRPIITQIGGHIFAR